jgi:hypothetical protein
MVTSSREHRPGRRRFCNDACQDGYATDRRFGVFTLPRSFAEAGCCMYCGAEVPTNAEKREEASSCGGDGVAGDLPERRAL